jgi:hypothetical protein
MAISLPANPTDGQIYIPGGNAPNYVWSATQGVWLINSVPSSQSVIPVQATAPVGATGLLWWNTNDGKLYIYNSGWAEATNSTIAVASGGQLGGVKVGTNLSVDSTGIISLAANPVIVGNLSLTTPTSGIELGSSSTSNTPYIDFHSGGGGTDYDGRIIASGGTGASAQGTLQFQAATLMLSGTTSVVGTFSVSGATSVSSLTASTSMQSVTMPANTNTVDVATTAFVIGQAGVVTPIVEGVASVGTSLKYAREDHVHPDPGSPDANVLHNAMFAVTQRGTGAWTTSVYTADRWLLQTATDTTSVTIVAGTDTDRAALGEWEATNLYQVATTGSATTTAYTYFCQRIESVRVLSGSTIAVSFWAKATTGIPKVGVSIDQSFGTGGSTTITGTGSFVTINTTWARYWLPFTLPSVAGKTIGTGDFTQLNFWTSSAATNTTRAGIGVQTATVQFWGMQCEEAAVATPFNAVGMAEDYDNTRRYYRLQSMRVGWYSSSGSTIIYMPVQFTTAMRSAPTVTYTTTTATNCSAPSSTVVSVDGFTLTTTPGLGAWSLTTTINATCDL